MTALLTLKSRETNTIALPVQETRGLAHHSLTPPFDTLLRFRRRSEQLRGRRFNGDAAGNCAVEPDEPALEL